MTETIDDLRREVERLRIAEQLALDAIAVERERSRSLLVHRHYWEEFGWPRNDLLECRECRTTKSKRTGEIFAR